MEHAGRGETITGVKTMLTFLSKAFKDLAEGSEALVEKVDKVAKAEMEKEGKRKIAAKVTPKKKAPLKKPSIRKAKKVTATAMVLKVIKRHKRGVIISTLRYKTGFRDEKVRAIVSRACRQGKIKRTGRGVYIAA